jgi:hypothetical protein
MGYNVTAVSRGRGGGYFAVPRAICKAAAVVVVLRRFLIII